MTSATTRVFGGGPMGPGTLWNSFWACSVSCLDWAGWFTVLVKRGVQWMATDDPVYGLA